MNKVYEHQGKPFTQEIAAELIFKTYAGQSPVNDRDLRERTYQIHEAGGGLPPKARYSTNLNSLNLSEYSNHIHSHVRRTVSNALSTLERNGCATRESLEFWHIHNMDIHRDEQTYPKRLGEGSQEVYLYYYRAYRENAVLKKINPVWKVGYGKILWRCKIGETHDQDTKTRVKQQIGVSPEKPVIALIIGTDNSRRLEKIIKDILKFWNRQVKDAQGTEWFMTSPAEVERIYDFLQLKGFMIFCDE